MILKNFTDLLDDLAYIKNNPDDLDETDLAWWKLLVLNDLENLKTTVANLGCMLKGMNLLYLDIIAIGLDVSNQLSNQITDYIPGVYFESDEQDTDND